MLTRPTLLPYELYVMKVYLQICNFLEEQLNKVATLEEDLEMLRQGELGNSGTPLSFMMKMVVLYRSEKKKILRSQINLI